MKKILMMFSIVLTLIFVISVIIFSKLYYKETPDSLIINNNSANCEFYFWSFWKESFYEYFKKHDMDSAVKNLKYGMDKTSIQYINQFMRNSYYYDRCVNLCKHYSKENLWSRYDKKLFKEFKSKSVPIMYKNLGYNPYIYKSVYGMLDLPKSVTDNINGKDILDIGAYPGDTPYTFHKYFPQSNIYAFEPVLGAKERVDKMIEELKKKDNTYNLIHSIQKGASGRNYIENQMEWDGYVSYNIPMVRLDDEYPKIGNNNLGLIKMDIEGAESAAVEGAKEIIKQYKPVLVIAIYHTPEDFFEMKNKIFDINPEYKFMIRRSENIIPDGDLVLIAY